MKKTTPLIKVRNLSISYQANEWALEDITFNLHEKRICGLVGMNGAGKSTLFKSLLNSVRLQTGVIKIAGKSVKKALKENYISYVPQTESIDWNFPINVYDVVMMGRYSFLNILRIPRKHDHRLVREALHKVGIEKLQKRQISELSGGQKKRVFIARALVQNAPIMLLDEPFTGVDIQSESAIIKLLKQLAREGKLIFVSTHNLGNVPRLCSEVLLLNKKVIAHGSVEEVFTQENLAHAFTTRLRHIQMEGGELHSDDDERRMTIIADDENPLVFYGKQFREKIISQKNKDE